MRNQSQIINITSFYGELSEILEYINQNITKKLTLMGIASKLFTSKSNLSAQFNQLLNMGFKTYVDTLKLQIHLNGY